MFGTGLIKGLGITSKRLFRKPLTQLYPYQMPAIAPASRIFLTLRRDDEGQTLCKACMTCVNGCPDHVLKLTKAEGEVRKPAEFLVDMGRCTFCGLCVENCTYTALAWSQDFEHAVYDRKELIYSLLPDTYEPSHPHPGDSTGEAIPA